jgi:CHAT domain-containing protein
MSLSRAFAFAGSPSMVVSLWSIGNQSTASITHRFNQYLKEGKPKDEALQLAKKEYLNDKNTSPNRRLPNCWAPYILTGDIEPLFTATWIKVLIGALSLFMGLLLYKVFRF